jgi:hypothetical protein
MLHADTLDPRAGPREDGLIIGHPCPGHASTRRAASLVWHRVYADFLMPSRLGAYRGLLEAAQRADYRVTAIQEFWDLLGDVDTDPPTAGAMWQVERALGVNGSYFFRLSTLDLALMAAIGEAGGEVSYHYEELAAVAKDRRSRTREDALRHLPEAQDRFRRNLGRLRSVTGLPMRVVASHGDFVNRRLGIANWVILADRQFRRDVGVELEAYDDELMSQLPIRSTDTAPPRCWIPDDPLAAIRRGEPVVYVLVHPRHWRVDRAGNARDDLRRLWEGTGFREDDDARAVETNRRRPARASRPDRGIWRR